MCQSFIDLFHFAGSHGIFVGIRGVLFRHSEECASGTAVGCQGAVPQKCEAVRFPGKENQESDNTNGRKHSWADTFPRCDTCVGNYCEMKGEGSKCQNNQSSNPFRKKMKRDSWPVWYFIPNSVPVPFFWKRKSSTSFCQHFP